MLSTPPNTPPLALLREALFGAVVDGGMISQYMVHAERSGWAPVQAMIDTPRGRRLIDHLLAIAAVRPADVVASLNRLPQMAGILVGYLPAREMLHLFGSLEAVNVEVVEAAVRQSEGTTAGIVARERFGFLGAMSTLSELLHAVVVADSSRRANPTL